MPIPDFSEDEDQRDCPATDPRLARRAGEPFVPIGRYTAAVLMKLEQKLPRIRVTSREHTDGEHPKTKPNRHQT